MKLLYFIFIVCVYTSLLVNAMDPPSFRMQQADMDDTHANPFPAINSVRLLSSDNEEFVFEKEFIQQSVLIKNMLQDMIEMDPIIPLHNITSKTLKKVTEWCDHHRFDPPPPVVNKDDIPDTSIDEWDQAFLQVDQETLFDIILAAYYLDIKPLLDAGTKTVANMIKGMSPGELKTVFNIHDDFTPEEEAQIRKENGWIENPIDDQ